MSSQDSWRCEQYRQSVASKIQEVIERSGMQVARSSNEMEQHVYMKAKNREEYLNMIAKIIIHIREMSQINQQNQGAPDSALPTAASRSCG